MSETLAPRAPLIASLRARVGMTVAVPLALAWTLTAIIAQSDAGGVVGVSRSAAWAGGLALIAAVAWAASIAIAQPLHALCQALDGRLPEDLSPLAEPQLDEMRPVVAGFNALLQHQREATERHKRLIADASHQLRTPLAVLRTQLQSTTAAALEQRLPEMLRTVDRATQVAQQFLSQLKIEQRQAQRTTWMPLRLDDIAQEAALEFSPLIAARRLEFALDAVPIALPADAWMLGELVRNLLANAIQHSPQGAALGIVVRRVTGRAELIVWDSGSGLSDDARERLFEPFAAATGGTGIGLGLSICKQLALALGAEVSLFNRNDGERTIGVDAVVRWALPETTIPSAIVPPGETS